jgi:hypothetical protein
MGSQAKAPAPLDRTSLCVNVGQALPPANSPRLQRSRCSLIFQASPTLFCPTREIARTSFR